MAKFYYFIEDYEYNGYKFKVKQIHTDTICSEEEKNYIETFNRKEAFKEYSRALENENDILKARNEMLINGIKNDTASKILAYLIPFLEIKDNIIIINENNIYIDKENVKEFEGYINDKKNKV